MERKAHVTKEQIERARRLDLLSYLQQYEPQELVKLAPGVYSLRSHDSLKISNGKWFRWSRGYGGVSALDYLVKVKEMDFVSAVMLLCDGVGFVPHATEYSAKPPVQKPFALPPANRDNKRVTQYLMARGLSEKLVENFINMGLIYEDTRHNCVFMGFDSNDVPRYAMLRSSDPRSTFMREWDGSDKSTIITLLIGNRKMKATTFAYVCAPIHSGASFVSAKRKEYCKTLFELGYVPICPSMLFSRVLADNVPEQRAARRSMSLELLRRCRVLVVCSDELTEEMEAEILLAKRLSIVSTTLAGIKKISLHTENGT